MEQPADAPWNVLFLVVNPTERALEAIVGLFGRGELDHATQVVRAAREQVDRAAQEPVHHAAQEPGVVVDGGQLLRLVERRTLPLRLCSKILLACTISKQASSYLGRVCLEPRALPRVAMGGLVASLLFQPPPPGMGAIFSTPESNHFW